MTSTPDIEAMRRVAEAATPGNDWAVRSSDGPFHQVVVINERGPVRAVADDCYEEEAAHIAASCPANVLAVLDRLAAAEAALAEREKQVADLCSALKPFAEAANLFFECDGLIAFLGTEISIGDLRRAATTLASIRAAAGWDQTKDI